MPVPSLPSGRCWMLEDAQCNKTLPRWKTTLFRGKRGDETVDSDLIIFVKDCRSLRGKTCSVQVGPSVDICFLSGLIITEEKLGP